MKWLMNSAKIAAVLAGLVFSAGDLEAQVSFGRSTAGGHWNDGNWILNSGATGFTPDINSTVYLGNDIEVPGSAPFAALNVFTNESVKNLFGDNGELTIQNGGSLFVDNTFDFTGGTVTVESGGTLTLDAVFGTFDGSGSGLVVDGGDATGIFQASNGATISVTSASTVDGSFQAFGSGSSIQIDAATTVGQVVLEDGASLNVFAATNFQNSSTQGVISATDSIVSLADDVDAEFVFVEGGSFFLNGGTLTTDNLIISRSAVTGNGPVISNEGGNFDVGRLVIDTDDIINMSASDNIRDQLSLGDGVVFHTAASLNLTEGVQISDQATLNLGGDLTAESLRQIGDLNRNGNTINVNQFSTSRNYTYDGTDTINEGVTVDGGATLEVNANLLDLDTLSVNNAVANFNEDGSFNSISVFAGELNVFDTLTTGFMSNINGVVNVEQQSGSMEGLAVDNLFAFGATLNFAFDDALSRSSQSQIDWAFRLTGDQQATLQGLIGSGTVTFSGGGGQSIGVLFDGSFTYLGHSAIPEPSTGVVLLGLGLVGLTRRRR